MMKSIRFCSSYNRKGMQRNMIAQHSTIKPVISISNEVFNIGTRNISNVKASSRLKITLATPHKTIMHKQEAAMIRFPSILGDFQLGQGSFPASIATDQFENVAELQRGLVTVKSLEDGEKKFLIQGGFAFVHDDEDHCSLHVTDAIPVELNETDNNYQKFIRKRSFD